MPLRRPAAIAFAAGLVVIVGGTAGLLLTHHSTPALRPVAAGVAALPAPTGPIVAPPQSAAAQIASPVSITIPLIGVKTNLITLGLAAGGAMQVPSSTTVAGWFTGSPRPGAIGSSIIVGHVDNKRGPGVFFRLSELKRETTSSSSGPTGPRRSSASPRSRSTRRIDFPTEKVYGPTPDAELRLITCGGAFDPATGHYLSNTIVYATQVR